MDIDTIMEDHGFSASSSCGGSGWYSKAIKHQGRDAFIAVTDNTGLGLPESLDEPVQVCVYDRDSWEEVDACQNFESLKSYIDALEQ